MAIIAGLKVTARDESNDPEGPITLYIEPGNAPAHLIAEVLITLDALYRSFGGDGLVVERMEVRETM
jgi:hypothetical protein